MGSPVRNLPGRYVHIASATSTQVVTGRAVLRRIIINGGTAGLVTIVDGVSGSTPAVAIIASTVVGSLAYDLELATGLRIVTAAATDVTVVYD